MPWLLRPVSPPAACAASQARGRLAELTSLAWCLAGPETRLPAVSAAERVPRGATAGTQHTAVTLLHHVRPVSAVVLQRPGWAGDLSRFLGGECDFRSLS